MKIIPKEYKGGNDCSVQNLSGQLGIPAVRYLKGLLLTEQLNKVYCEGNGLVIEIHYFLYHST